MKRSILIAAVAAGVFALAGCASVPAGASTARGFDLNRYLGKWYEIARFDFAFEKGLDNTSAEYSLRPDGAVGVLNRGYDYGKGVWKEARGKAKFRGSPDVGELEVSFFGPFYAAYNVIALDEDYRYALVAGQNLKYLWILSREKTIPDPVRSSYLAIAENLGYRTGDLIWVEHDR